MSDGDLDLSLSPIKKNVAKQGRRAGGSSWTGVDDDNQESWKELSQKPGQDDIFLDSRERVNKSDFSKRRTGGWADSRNNSFSQKTSSLDKTDHSNDDDDDDLPIIPDLEEVEKEDFAQRVADAPNVAVNRVDTYKELDSDLFKHAAFATLEEVDLRLLTRHMVPEQSLKEPDENWTWEKLFADVSSQMQSEWFPTGGDLERNQSSNGSEQLEKHDRPFTAFNKFPV